MLSINDLTIDILAQCVYCQGREIHLTPSESKIVVYLIRNRGQVIDREAFYEGVWGLGRPPVDRRQIDLHVRNLRLKIEPDPNQPRYIRTVPGVGYRQMSIKLQTVPIRQAYC